MDGCMLGTSSDLHWEGCASVSSILSAGPQSTHLLHNDHLSTSESSGPTDDEGGVDDDYYPKHNNQVCSMVVNDSLSLCSGSGGSEPGGVNGLERIIRTHPIWYLPHIGRTAASHLLRSKEMGSFVIRASSKAQSMALSIRLPLGMGMDIDHYLVETLKNGTVRLEGSPFTFSALPFLLQHYTLHGEELQTKLRLPSAVFECQTRRDLQSLALLGQDFWTSEQSCSRSSSVMPSQSPLPPAVQSTPPPLPDKHSGTYDNCSIDVRPCESVTDTTHTLRNKCASVSQVSPQQNLDATSFRVKRWFSNSSKVKATPPEGMSRVFPDAKLADESSVVSKLLTSSVHSCDVVWDIAPSAQLSTFKPQHSGSDNVCKNQLKQKPRPPLKPKPAARPGLLRREKSDLGGWASKDINDRRGKAIKEKCTLLQEYDIEQGGHILRLRPTSPPQPSNLVTDDFAMPKSKTADANLHRVWSGRQRQPPEKRLSAPNLVEALSNKNSFSHAFNRRPGQQAELPTISEGLVTPLARRKKLLADSLNEGRGLDNSDKFKKSLEDLLKAMFPAKSTQMPKTPAASPLIRKYNSERVKTNYWTTNPVLLPAGPVSDTLPVSKSGRPTPAPRINRNWSAVADEMKTRQKVAKVPPNKHSSEYAQLSDFSDLFVSKSHCRDIDEDNISIAGTVFNEPWDSTVWENLIDLAQFGQSTSANEQPAPSTTNVAMVAPTVVDTSETRGSRRTSLSSVNGEDWVKNNVTNHKMAEETWSKWDGNHMKRGVAINPWDDGESVSSSPTPVLSPRVPSLAQSALNRRYNKAAPGTKIQNYIEGLSEDTSTVFGATIRQFVECTVQSEETDPHVVLRNIRQFLNGLKNYLVKHGEGGLHDLIEGERAGLQADQLLNIDALLETLLYKIVLKPLKAHVYHLMVKQQSNAGTLHLLSNSLAQVRCLSLSDFGLGGDEIETERLEKIRDCFRRMQHEYSPLKKLENLLDALQIGSRRETSTAGEDKLPEADELVRWMVVLLSRCSIVGAEMEATYMWALLCQPILAGEASYYLTALFSAIHMLKAPETIGTLGQDPVNSRQLSSCSVTSLCNQSISSFTSNQGNCDGFIKVAVPNETGNSIKYHTLPALPMMNTAKLCRMIAHKAQVTNSEDHGLYLLVDGFETCLMNSECPEVIQDSLRQAGKQYMFAYKRHEAKIAWPKVAMSPRL